MTAHPTDALRLVPDEVKQKALDLCLHEVEGFAGLSAAKKTDIHGMVVRLLAAPASPLPEGGGWQNISTAPKDGTVILTYGSLHNDGAPYGIGEKPTVKISQYSAEGEFWCCDAWGSHEPVWWMPLPAAPTGEAK